MFLQLSRSILRLLKLRDPNLCFFAESAKCFLGRSETKCNLTQTVQSFRSYFGKRNQKNMGKGTPCVTGMHSFALETSLPWGAFTCHTVFLSQPAQFRS